MSLVIAFSGKIASGKTKLSEAVADRLGWPRASFGRYIRELAQSRGLDSKSRKVLQDLGESQVQYNLEEFVSAVLQTTQWRPGAPLILEGLRHREVADFLRQYISPAELLIIHVDADRRTRFRRVADREGASSADFILFDDFDTHPTEVQVEDVLPEMADLILDGTLELTVLVQQVVDLIQDILKEPRRPVAAVLGPRVYLNVWFSGSDNREKRFEVGHPIQMGVALRPWKRTPGKSLPPDEGNEQVVTMNSVDVWVQCPDADVSPREGKLGLPLPTNELIFSVVPKVSGSIRLDIVLFVKNEPIHHLRREIFVRPSG